MQKRTRRNQERRKEVEEETDRHNVLAALREVRWSNPDLEVSFDPKKIKAIFPVCSQIRVQKSEKLINNVASRSNEFCYSRYWFTRRDRVVFGFLFYPPTHPLRLIRHFWTALFVSV